MNEIIYLEPDEDITGVISRMKESESSMFALVIPRGGTIAQSIVNLKILKREADEIKKEVSLVTSDKIAKNLASQVGMTVYSSANEAKLAKPMVKTGSSFQDVKNPNGIRVNRYYQGEEDAPAQNDAGVGEKMSENISPRHNEENNRNKLASNIHPPKIKKIGSRKKPIMIVGSIILVALLLLSYIFIPSATAKLILKSSNLEKNIEITVDKRANNLNEEAVIPGEEVETVKETTKTYQANGTKDVGEKASGEITFYNDYDINPQIIAAGTVLVANNKKFTLDQTISIPGASVVSLVPLKTNPGTTKGKITATSPGAEYNIDTSNFIIESFSGSKSEKIYGQSSQALSGGSSKKVTVISNEDMENAKADIQTELEESAKTEILEKSGENSMLLATTVKSEEESFSSSKNVDEETAQFTLTKKIRVRAITFNDKKFREVTISKSEKDLPEDQAVINPNDSEITYEVISFDEEAGKVKLNTKFKGKVGKKINEGEIKGQITNQKLGKAINTIKNIEGVEDVEISTWPSFLPLTPFIKQRINIEYGYSD